MEISDRERTYIDSLIATGLHGPNRADVLRTLMRRGIADLIASGILKPLPLSSDPNQLALFE